MNAYDHKKLEKKWQKEWAKKKLYQTPDKKKGAHNSMLLVEFPYPSGNLHVGHWYAFAVPDILARYLRMTGKNVMYPIGFDAFGLPAENAAIKNKLTPRTWTYANLEHMQNQIRSMGTSFDWSRQVITCDPSYYKWTQWLFLQFFKNGLAYRKETLVNWCPKDKTVLANEQVIGGFCERCDTEVIQKQMLQWNLKITDYADRLVDDLEGLHWPQQIKESQRNWIGRSEGAEIDFEIDLPGYAGEVVFASNNHSKFERVEKLLQRGGFTMTLRKPSDLGINDFDVVEDGTTLAQNAEKKARALAEKTKLPVLGMDSGFFIDDEKIDPITVKRNALKGKDERLLDQLDIADLMLRFYQKIAKKHGGKVDAYWRDAICLITPEKFAIHSECVREVVLTDTERGVFDPYFPLRSLFISKKTGKYAQEQNAEEWFDELEPLTHALKKLWTPLMTVFTTRPDTIFGATYLVLAPEHPFVSACLEKPKLIENNGDVLVYVTAAKKKSDLERQMDAKDKTGVRLGDIQVTNPATGIKIPVFVADYVLPHYGTGAIMAVPGHDERDYAFAKVFDLPIVEVVSGGNLSVAPFTEEGPLVNSGEFDGLSSSEAKKPMTEKYGHARKNYKMRDWVISRQRYWGVPIPIIHCPKCGPVSVPEKQLPVELPEVKDYLPAGEGKSPLAKERKWVEVECPKCAEDAKKTKYLIFDFDGVLGDTLTASLKARIAMGDASDMDEARESMQKYFSAKPLHARGDHFTDERKKHYHDWSRRYAIEVAKIKYPLFSDFIKEIKKLEHAKIAVVSAGYDLYSKGPLKKSGLKYTHFYAGNHDHSKENKIEKVCKAWKVSEKDVYYFTDTQADVYELENLLDRSKIIGCAWGYQGEKKLQELLPQNQILKKAKDIHDIWKPCIAERETDTFDTFVDSSWYFQRYADPKNKKAFADPKKLAAWMPVDLYSGGAEHTTMHLLYSRFWHKAMFDLGLVRESEPYVGRMNRSLIMGPDGQKMSKSRGNVIDPDTVVAQLGADTVRMYLAFIGPYNEVSSYPWNPDGVVGVRRFLERVWRRQERLGKTNEKSERALQVMIQKMSTDVPEQKFNTAIAAMMGWMNVVEAEGVSKKQYATFLRLLAPFAPHLSEEIWRGLGNRSSIHLESWPKFDPKKLVSDTVTIVVQVNGKMRAQMEIATNATQEDIEALALKEIGKWLEGVAVKRVIYVPGRLVNIVAG